MESNAINEYRCKTYFDNCLHTYYFQQTIDLINEGNLKVKDVVTDEIELNDIVESGFEQLVNDKSQTKILVKL
jgi:threonine dehydrogenase-like Zn-dependent dehydrogenase